MRTYVILNGVDSRSLDGLLVQKLPPISKPQMRVTTETIDGRDGDQITPLGYAAYDKTLTIGLHGNYDIDEIIKFFDSSGTVIFSNEPEKVYNYNILAKIDFNKLVRFRTASVNFHVQPFKYSAEETALNFISPGSEVDVYSQGNTQALPTYTLTGSGAVTIQVGTNNPVTVNLSAGGQTCIIDLPNLEASAPNGTLLNRQLTGEYLDLALEPGDNEIYLTGSVSRLEIADFSRWI